MTKQKRVAILASFAGVVATCSLVTLVVALLANDPNYWQQAFFFSAAAVFLAIVSWSGLMFRNGDLPSSGAWLGMFFAGVPISMFFLYLDCGGRLPQFHPAFVCEGSPGISVIFTIGAVGMTEVSLPGALRAWIIEKFSGEA